MSEPDEGGVHAGGGVLALVVLEAEAAGGAEPEAGVAGVLDQLGDVEVEGLEEDAHAEAPEHGEDGGVQEVEGDQLEPAGQGAP